ncbi:hypothetical protein Tco_0931465 [Tanacetum coccineum]
MCSTPKEPFKGFSKDSFALVLKDGSQPPVKELNTSKPVLVLDDSCIKEYDFSFSLMGKVKDVAAIPNLYSILSNEGFHYVKLSYLGGMWILYSIGDLNIKEQLFNYTGVRSWFTTIKQASNSFVCEERIIWVEIEGLPIKALTPNSFRRIASLWGEIVELGDSDPQSLSSKLICLKMILLMKSVAKEMFFLEKEGDKNKLTLVMWERVSDLAFAGNDSVYENSSNKNASAGNSHFEDPFNIYCLLNDQHKKASKSNTIEPEYPPGFTPVTDIGANPDATSLNGVNDQIHSLSTA